MTKEDKIKGLRMELEHGYDESIVSQIHQLRIDIKAEKERNIKRPIVYKENIVILAP